MKYYIVADNSGSIREIDLPDELAGKFYERVQNRYDDCFTFEQCESKIPVLMAIDFNGYVTDEDDDFVENKGWKQDKKWGIWNTKTDFWDKIT